MNYLQKNLEILVSAMRSADAQYAILNYYFDQPMDTPRADVIWKNQAELLITDVDNALDRVTIACKSSVTFQGETNVSFVEKTYSFIRCLYIFYKQVRVALMEQGIVLPSPGQGGLLQLDVDNPYDSFWEHRSTKDGLPAKRIPLSTILISE